MLRLHRTALAGVMLAASGILVFAGAADDSTADGGLPPPADKPVDFARDIEPLFAKRCLKCHGPEKQQAGFRLDIEGDAVRGGDIGAAFVPGKSADSLLIKYVAGLDPDVIMPPDGEKLSTAEIGLLRAWIDQGARWSSSADAGDSRKNRHWSFQQIRRPVEQVVRNEAWVRNPLDRFILSRLEKEQIPPSPEADRRTLIRRLSLDLLGLPPTLEEVEAFASDESEDAYEQLVDRFLSSPHYGERWARHWLDLARFADSDGYEKDSPRPYAWRYRNWVIDALNRDLPFDQFTIEQLAGDLLPDATIEQKVATGFHRNTLTNKEGGADQEEFRVAAVVDRVNTTSTVWLGLTLGCAQCHSHKYDPVSLREYYGVFAFFNQGQEVDLSAPLPDEAEAYANAKRAFDRAHAPFLATIAEFETNSLPARAAEWEKGLNKLALPVWKTLEPVNVESRGGATLTRQPDGSFLVSGTRPATDSYVMSFKINLPRITGLRLEVLPDKSLPASGPGRVAHGNFVLSEITATVTTAAGESQPVVLQSPQADFSQEKWPVAAAIDGDTKTGWAIAPQFGLRHVAVFEVRKPHDISAGSTLTVTLDQQYGSEHMLGRFRVSVTSLDPPLSLEGIPEDVATIVQNETEARTADQRKLVLDFFASIDPELARHRQAEAEHARLAPSPPQTKAQTLADVSQPRRTRIHIRGDFLRPGEEVLPHTPAVLPPLGAPGGRPANRLDLAHWLVSPSNPLTARVAVNRIWKQLFGQALVTSMEDFGTRGEKPSHPELLDWLASEFMQPLDSRPVTTEAGAANASIGGRWSQKRLIRLIVTSATYRQSSQPRRELRDRDPKNVLLARQNRFRVEAEVLRDVALAAGGLLTRTVGGPSVRPRQPAGVSELTYAGSARWVESTGAERYRRGLYTWFQRTSPYPMLMMFDAPDSNITCTRRDRSNTPLQALTLLNDPVFFECAQALGRRAWEQHPTDVDERLRLAFALCTARPPSADELVDLRTLATDLRNALSADPAGAVNLAGANTPESEARVELAASVAVARVLLNLDETVTRE